MSEKEFLIKLINDTEDPKLINYITNFVKEATEYYSCTNERNNAKTA